MVRDLAVIESSGETIPRKYEARIITGNHFQNAITTHAERIDGHFLLYTRVHTQRESLDEHIFGVVDTNNPEEANNRIYLRARDFVKECAIDDRTVHVKKTA